MCLCPHMSILVHAQTCTSSYPCSCLHVSSSVSTSSCVTHQPNMDFTQLKQTPFYFLEILWPVTGAGLSWAVLQLILLEVTFQL